MVVGVLFPNQMFTYVRTEVNYTEEVDDPVDSDGEHNSHLHNSFLPTFLLLVSLECVLILAFCRGGFGLRESGVQHL